jgi:predicted CXXCH cytochrome family protein
MKKRLADKGATVHPIVPEDCSSCHVPHASNLPALLKGPPAKLCLDCHDVAKDPIIKTHGGYAFGASDCMGCHVPHLSAKKGLLRPEVHMPFGDKMCESCHYPPQAKAVYPVPKPGGLKNCTDCHDFSGLEKLAKPHDPVKKGDCWKCHLPHAASLPHLLKGSALAICVPCHDLGAPKTKEAHEFANAGLDCTSCHVAHEPSKIKEAPKPPPPPPEKKGAPKKGAPAKGGKKK